MLKLIKILMPLPKEDFDPTEAAIPWKILSSAGHQITIATSDGKSPQCDPRMLNGKGLGPLASVLAADSLARQAYSEFSRSREFLNPLTWQSLKAEDFDLLLLPGGHAPGMKEYLESEILHILCGKFFDQNKIVAAICHGVVLAGRSHRSDGKSGLYGKKTTALLFQQEMLAWMLTFGWLGNYYRTYRISVEEEVKAKLADAKDFQRGPPPLFRDNPENLSRGFAVVDGNYISARWPGDAHAFAHAILSKIQTSVQVTKT